MLKLTNRQIVLATRPTELPQREHFEIIETPMVSLGAGDVLVKIRYVALSPWQGQRLKDFRNFTRPFAIGELIDCDALGKVVASNDDAMPVGQVVTGRMGWQEYAVIKPSALSRVDADAQVDELMWLTTLSSPGLTAYCAMDLFGRPAPGQTLVVTSAAGSVGSYAVQLGKLAGARVVGICGGQRKCAHVLNELGADVAIDHQDESFEDALRDACGGNAHLFFDTVGGPIADTVFEQLAKYARVLFVGRTASNNSATPHLDPVNLRQLWAREASMQCFSRYSYDERWAFAKDRMLELCQQGRIRSHHNVVEGFSETPQALHDMLAGKYTGKVLVHYA